jgi:hypothetical protein
MAPPNLGQHASAGTILQIHSIISSALDLGVRYDWADRNVAKNASPPHPRSRERTRTFDIAHGPARAPATLGRPGRATGEVRYLAARRR